jgi:hypothetical protein
MHTPFQQEQKQRNKWKKVAEDASKLTPKQVFSMIGT